jgi:Zn finger protein HypA/HybF involved in hydrogenase expression
MTRDVDPAGIMSLTEYELAVRASERTKMSRHEIQRLDDFVSHELKTGGCWCQNCSRVQVEKQADFCPACLELLQRDDQ